MGLHTTSILLSCITPIGVMPISAQASVCAGCAGGRCEPNCFCFLSGLGPPSHCYRDAVPSNRDVMPSVLTPYSPKICRIDNDPVAGRARPK